MPATELAYISLKPGLDLESPTPEAETWKETLITIAAQEGYKNLYWGRLLEDPSVLLLAINWESKDSHQKFIKAPSYGPFKETLGKIMTGVHLHHIDLEPPSIIGTAPCTEVATFFECEGSFLATAAKFAKFLDEAKPEGYYGCAYGKVIEKIVSHGEVGKDDIEESNAVVAFLGWESKEAHLQFRDTTLFGENVGLLGGKDGGAEVFHVPFKTFKTGEN